MMAKQPDHRFQTPAEVARALVPFFKSGKAALSVPVSSPPVAQPAQSPPLPWGQTVIEPPPDLHPPTLNLQSARFASAAELAPGSTPSSVRRQTLARKIPVAVAAVAMGVLMLAGLSTWAPGIFTRKPPELTTTNRQPAPVPTAVVPAALEDGKPGRLAISARSTTTRRAAFRAFQGE